MTFVVLTLLFGAFALVDGVLALAAAVRRFEHHRVGGWLLFEGIVGVLVGLLAFVFTDLTALALLALIAFWAIVTGLFEIAAAVDLRRTLRHEWLLILSGIASMLFGVLLFFFPGAGIVAVSWIVASYALLFGALELGLAWRLRGLRHHGAAVAEQQGMPPIRLA